MKRIHRTGEDRGETHKKSYGDLKEVGQEYAGQGKEKRWENKRARRPRDTQRERERTSGLRTHMKIRNKLATLKREGRKVSVSSP